MTIISVLFSNLNSGVNFVNNDMLNSLLVNFDNFCKNTFKILPTLRSRSDWAWSGSRSSIRSS